MATRGRDAGRPGDDDAAVVDRLLRRLRANPTPEPAMLPRAASPGGFRSPGLDGNSALRTNPPAPGPTPREMGRAGVWARVGLGVVVAGALTQWPYARACGVGLLVYLLAVATVLVAGLWGATASWQGRLAAAHVIALSTVLWGLVLAAHEVLPRAGYIATSATWRCVPVDGSVHPSAPAGSDSAPHLPT